MNPSTVHKQSKPSTTLLIVFIIRLLTKVYFSVFAMALKPILLNNFPFLLVYNMTVSIPLSDYLVEYVTEIS